MKKFLTTIALLLLGYTTFSQVGIGNTNPEASLDISASNIAAPNNNDGLLIPRIDDFPLSVPTAAQDGMMVFITGAGTPTKGFYYWDQDAGPAAWVRISGTEDADWFETGTTSAPSNNTDDIFTLGFVGIGVADPQNPLEIGVSTSFDLDHSNDGQDGIFIIGQGDNSGINAIGGSISFGPPSSTRGDQRKSAIASVQTSGDDDHTGLAFYVHGNAINQSPMVEGMRLTHQRYLGINNNNPSATLDVVGTMQFEDGNEAAGYVLGSDASGNASWVDPNTLVTDDTDWTTVGANIERQSGDVYIGDTNATNNDVYISDRIIDWDNASYYLNPEDVSVMDEILFDNGTSSDPSIRFLDIDTGFYSPGTGLISFTGNGTERFRIQNDGEIQFRTTTATNYDFTTLGTFGNDGISVGSSSLTLPVVSGFIANDSRENILRLDVQSGNSNFDHSTIYATNNIGGTTARLTYNDGTPTGRYAVYANGGTGYAGYFLGDLTVGTTTANTYTLPASRGTNGQTMQTDGAGNVSWVTQSSSVTASNGLTEVTDDIQLGGTLTQNTTINQGNFDMHYQLGSGSTADFQVIRGGGSNLITASNDGYILLGDTATLPDPRLQVTGGATFGSYMADFYNNAANPDAAAVSIRVRTSVSHTGNYIGFFKNETTLTGHINGNGSGGVNYSTVSDRRLKNSILDIDNGLELINKIQPRIYEYKTNIGKKEYGFIAQELQEIYPQAVFGDPNGDVKVEPMMVDYGRLTPILTAAIQELNNENQIIKDRLKTLEAKNQNLEAKLKAFKTLEARLSALENGTSRSTSTSVFTEKK